MTATDRRRVVATMQAEAKISERRAIRFTGFARSSMRYKSLREPQAELELRIKELAEERPRAGYRRIHTFLRREGWPVNRKRVQRIYRVMNLAVRRRGKKRRSLAPRPVRDPITAPNKRWSMDFVSDALASGRRFRCLTVLDEHTRESLAIHAARSIPATSVIHVLERLRGSRGLPEVIMTDNGPEFTSQALDAWAYARGIKVEFIQPGKPVQNCYIESFNGTFRDECLNLHWFLSLDDARAEIERWRADYNHVRPHSSLKQLTPDEFAEAQRRHAELATIS